VRWGKAGEIATTWIFTIPCAALMGAALFTLHRFLPGAD